MQGRRDRMLRMAAVVVLVVDYFGAGLFLAVSPSLNEHYVVAVDSDAPGPFAYEAVDGELVGLDVELLEAMAEDQKFTVTFEQMAYDDALAALDADRVDAVMAGVEITDELDQSYDFSDPYLHYGTVLGVAQSEDGIASFDDLRGRRVGALTDSVAADFAESSKDEYGFTVVYFDDVDAMFEAARSGHVHAFFDESVYLRYDIATGVDMKIVPPVQPGPGIGLVVDDGRNADLIESFNDGLRDAAEHSRYHRIVETYQGPGPWIPFEWSWVVKTVGWVLFFNAWWIIPTVWRAFTWAREKFRPSAPAADEPAAVEPEDAIEPEDDPSWTRGT